MDNTYKVLEKLKVFLRQGNHTNSVTFGNLSDIDLSKLNIYPLAHLKIENVELTEKVVEFNIKIIAADVVDIDKEPTDDDIFYGNDNLQDVLNTQLQVINRAFEFLLRGDLRDEGFETEAPLFAEPFLDRFEMQLAGWTADIKIRVLNDYAIC